MEFIVSRKCVNFICDKVGHIVGVNQNFVVCEFVHFSYVSGSPG